MDILWVAFTLGIFLAILQIWFLQIIIDWLLFSRVLDDPVEGKVLATLAAYVVACVLKFQITGSTGGFVWFLPGALLVGFFEFRKGRKLRAKIQAARLESNVG